MLENIFVVYLVFVNIAAFGMYGIDKQKAIRKQWRIPEAQLLAVAAIGGSAGALLGMQFFHHKTRKWKFRLGVPLILSASSSTKTSMSLSDLVPGSSCKMCCKSFFAFLISES